MQIWNRRTIDDDDHYFIQLKTIEASIYMTSINFLHSISIYDYRDRRNDKRSKLGQLSGYESQMKWAWVA